MAEIPFYDFKAVSDTRRQDMHQAVDDVLDTGMTILGPQLELFEQEFAEYCGAAHCIGVGNGLDALSLSLRALGIGHGDEVIVPAQTFVATWLAVSQVGAKPVAVDVRRGTTTLDPERVQQAVTSRTRAILPVHLFGQCADMDALIDIAAADNLAIVEDAAQAHGARYRDQRSGTMGTLGAFSFYPTKNLGALGDGGAIVTNDVELDRRLRKLRNYGSTTKYVHEVSGYNSRLDELQAAYLRHQLRKLDGEIAERQAIARRYRTNLAGLEAVELSSEMNVAASVYHLFVVRLKNRDDVARKLKARGIGTGIHYPTVPGRQPIYSEDHRDDNIPVALGAAASSLSLPLWPGMKVSQVDDVCQCIEEILAEA